MLFEKATRERVRFNSTKGQLSVEDLWSLPLTSKNGASLDAIAIELDRDIKTDTVSFVEDTTPKNDALQLKFDIVKHIIDVRKKENAERLAAAEKAAKRQAIMLEMAKRQENKIGTMSDEELEEALTSL